MSSRTIRKVIITTATALGLAAMAAVQAMAQSSGTVQRPDSGTPAEAGYGSGYGPGMMYGGNGYGMGYGPGMMGGAYGWGPETTGALGLSESQQKQIREIQERLGKRQWGLMQAMHGQMRHLWRSYYGKGEDINAIIKARRTMFDMRLQMLRNRLEAQKQIRAVLTEAQRKKFDELEHWGSGYSY